MVVLPGLIWLGGLVISSVSAQSEADIFILTQSSIKPFAKIQNETDTSQLHRVPRGPSTIPDQQWKGIPDTKIYTFDDNKKVEASSGTFFRATGKTRGSQVNDAVKPKPWPHQANHEDPMGCGNPLCVVIDMKPRRFKSMCQLKKFLKEQGRMAQVNFVQKGDCYDIIDNKEGATNKPWTTPGDIKDCSACVKSDTCGNDPIILNIDISNVVMGYSSAFGGPKYQENESGSKRMAGLPFEFSNICDAMKFLEQSENTNLKTQVVGVSFGCVADIYPTQGDNCLFTEWFDLDTPCNSDKDVESHCEHKLTLDSSLTGPQRICNLEDVKQYQYVGGSEVSRVAAQDAMKGNAVGTRQGSPKFGQKLQVSSSEIACLAKDQEAATKLPPPFIYKDDKNNSCLDYKARWCCRSQAMFRPMPISVLLNNRVPEALPIGIAVTVPTYDTKTGMITSLRITIYCGSKRAPPHILDLMRTDASKEFGGNLIQMGQTFKISATVLETINPDDSIDMKFTVGFYIKNNLSPIGTIEIKFNKKVTAKYAVWTQIKSMYTVATTILRTGDTKLEVSLPKDKGGVPASAIGKFDAEKGEYPFTALIVSNGEGGGIQEIAVNLNNDQAFVSYNQGVLQPPPNATDIFKNLENIVSTFSVTVAVDSPPLATLFAECDWKDWVNIDHPNRLEGTNGEYELRFKALAIEKLKKNVCGSVPNAAHYVDAVTKETQIPWAELKMGNVVYETFKLTPFFGYACKDENGEKEFCIDMKVRYCCAKEVRATWSEWQPWGACSVKCGGGQMERSRSCVRKTKGQGANYNPKCFGEEDANSEITRKRFTTQVQPCNVEACPVDFKWGCWSSWSKCSISCGQGTKSRKRVCEPAVNGGKDCPPKKQFLDLYEQIQNCAEKDCERFEEGPWTAWSACTATCGKGQMTRRRICRSMETLATCPDTFCQSDPTQPLPTDFFVQTLACSLQECPVTGGWTNWELWSSCSQSCVIHPDVGGPSNLTMAFRQRKRYCANPIPAFGGSECEKNPKYEYVSNEKAEKDKTDCITEDTKGVGSYENKETSAITPWCPENCIYSEWGPWSACDRTCMDLDIREIYVDGLTANPRLVDLRGVRMREHSVHPAYPKRTRFRCLVKDARYGGTCPEKDANQMTPSSRNGTAIWQIEDCKLCKEHCQGNQNSINASMLIAQMPPLPYPTKDPSCVGWCPIDCQWKKPVLPEEKDCSCALTRLAKEESEDYKKISEIQRKQINNCFLPRTAVIAANGTTGVEKGILDEISSTLMKMADEINGKTAEEALGIVKKYRDNRPAKFADLASDPSTAKMAEQLEDEWPRDVKKYAASLANSVHTEIQSPVFEGLFGGKSCVLPAVKYLSKIVSTLAEKQVDKSKYSPSYYYDIDTYCCKHPICQLTPAELNTAQPGVLAPCERAAWGQWGEWGTCNEKCGDKGTRSRQRECLSICEPDKKMDPVNCAPYRDSTTNQTWTAEYKGPCIPCPPEYSGTWSDWTSWSAQGPFQCAKEPGQTIKMTRKRECIQTSHTVVPCREFKGLTSGVVEDSTSLPLPPCP